MKLTPEGDYCGPFHLFNTTLSPSKHNAECKYSHLETGMCSLSEKALFPISKQLINTILRKPRNHTAKNKENKKRSEIEFHDEKYYSH